MLKKMLIAAALLAATLTGAYALDFTVHITQLDGSPFLGPDGKEIKTTLATVSETALTSSYQDEAALPPGEKSNRFWLAQRIHIDPKNVVLSPEEITLLKKLIDKAYNPLVVGQAWAVLDPTTVPKK